MKYIGIDYGTKRIGLARSDESGSIAFPLVTIVAGPHTVGEIAAIAQKESAQKIILGESRNFKGEANKVMEDIERFKKDLEEVAGVPVVYEAEFLSSAAAARQYHDYSQPRRPERVGAPTKASESKLDASAAAVILQSYLDRIKNHKNYEID
ncbi:MAG: Holliday junction resolvase RuvX [Minisyncoccia bacterium]